MSVVFSPYYDSERTLICSNTGIVLTDTAAEVRSIASVGNMQCCDVVRITVRREACESITADAFFGRWHGILSEKTKEKPKHL